MLKGHSFKTDVHCFLDFVRLLVRSWIDGMDASPISIETAIGALFDLKLILKLCLV